MISHVRRARPDRVSPRADTLREAKRVTRVTSDGGWGREAGLVRAVPEAADATELSLGGLRDATRCVALEMSWAFLNGCRERS